jgi:hypothetical protein
LLNIECDYFGQALIGGLVFGGVIGLDGF